MRAPRRRRLLRPARDPLAARILEGGARPLADAELLSCLLTGITLRDARRLLTDAGGLQRLAALLPGDLRRHPRLSPSRQVRLLAALELGRRTTLVPDGRAPCFLQPQTVADYLLARYGNAAVEEFGVLLLDSRGCLRKAEIIATGTCDRVTVEARDVFRAALIHRATRVIVFHNHPSGNPTPSASDRRLTRTLVVAGRALGIEVVDHVVIGDGCYRSFASDSEM